MKSKRLDFWRPDHWKKVIFSDESSFRCVSARTPIKRPKSNQYDLRYSINTLNHPPYLMDWAAFSGKHGAEELFFLDPKQTMCGDIYLDVLKDQMLGFFTCTNLTVSFYMMVRLHTSVNM